MKELKNPIKTLALIFVFISVLFLHGRSSEKSLVHFSGFTENKGQFRDQHGNPNPDVLYMADFGGMKVQLRKDGFSYEVYQVKPKWVDPATIPYKIMTITDRGDTSISWPGKAEAEKELMYHYQRVDVVLAGCDQGIVPIPENQVGTSRRWLLGKKEPYITEVRNFSKINFENVYPGIDMIYYTNPVEGTFKYDFTVKPGADASQIRLKYTGDDGIIFDGAKTLKIKTRFGTMTETIPACYRVSGDGKLIPDESIGFRINNDEVGFTVNKPSKNSLVIDPSINLEWAGYFSGDSSDVSTSAVFDSNGDTYICGTTMQFLPYTPLGDSANIPWDGFLRRVDKSGNEKWSVYLDGFFPNDLAINKYGQIVMVSDAGILAFDTSGTFSWINNEHERRKAVTCDPAGNIITIGDSVVKRGPMAGILWKVKFGGSGTTLNDVACDGSGNIYFAGQTTDSAGIGTPGAFLETYNGTQYIGTGWQYNWELVGNPRAGDGFFGKMTPGGQVLFGSYYGGDKFDIIDHIAVSDSGCFALAGNTNSRNGIATPGAFQDTLRHQGVYAFQYIAIGFSWDCPEGYWQFLDTCISGWFAPTAYDNHCQSTDGFMAIFNSSGNRIYSTYYGDTDSEFDLNVCINPAGDTISLGGISTGNKPVVYNYWAVPRVFTYYHPNLYTRYSYNDNGSGPFIAQFRYSGNRIWGTYYPRPEDLPDIGNLTIAGINYIENRFSISGSRNAWGAYGFWDGNIKNYICSFRTSDFHIDTITNPVNIAPCIGDTAILTCGIVTIPATDLDFQWYKNDIPLVGRTDSTLIIPDCSTIDTGSYHCVISRAGFTWMTTTHACIAFRDRSALNAMPQANQTSPFQDARLLADMDANGSYDVVCQGKIAYNDSLSFVRNDTIPSLLSQTEPIDPFNENKPSIFTHDPECMDYPTCLRASKLIRKTTGRYTALEHALLNGIVAWADFDNDGTQEGLRIAKDPWGVYLFLVKIKPDTIFQLPAGTGSWSLWASCHQQAEAADYDQDGDVDVLFTGTSLYCSWNKINTILVNSGGIFQELPLPFLNHERDGYTHWFDADGDGDLDILFRKKEYVGGFPNYNRILNVFSNTAGNYQLAFSDTLRTDQQGETKPVTFDFENDGMPDIVLQNILFQRVDSSYFKQTNILSNTYGNVFTGLTEDAIAVGDIDNDGDLDMLGQSRIFINNACNPPNSAPSAPAGLATFTAGDTVSFSWQRATDLQTPQMGLTYNLRVGTMPGGNNIMSSMSDASGWRKVVGMGNVYQNTGWWLHSLAPGTYYWSVQAIDNSFAGGPFAPEQTFTIAPPVPVNTAVASDTVTTGQTLCFDATSTITAGGGGSSFKVQGEGSVTMIAGQKISLLPVVQVDPGGYLHGYITNSNDYCFQAIQPMVQAKQANENQGLQGLADNKAVGWMVKVYPNPTSGNLYLLFNTTGNNVPVQVNMYNLFGERVWSADMTGITEYTVSTELLPPGMYLLKVVLGLRSKIVKVIRN